MAAYIRRKDYYGVGDASIDAKHKQILDNVNELYNAMQGPQDTAVTKEILDRMSDYARTHFEHEEKLLRELNYPEFANQKAEHDKMRRQIAALRENLSAVTARDVLVFLKDWWTAHIQQEGRKYAAYLVKQPSY